MVSMRENRRNFPAADTMGRSCEHRMIAKGQERASVVEEQSEGRQLEARQMGYLKVSRESEINRWQK